MLPVFFNASGSSHFNLLGVLLHGVFFVVLYGFEQSLGILFLLLLLALLLLLLLTVLLVLLVLLLLLLLLVVLVLLLLLLVLTVVALLVFVVFLVLVVLILVAALLLLLLLLCLLEHLFGVGEVVAGVVVFGREFEGLLVVVDRLLELLHAFGTVLFVKTGLQVAVATVVENLAALLVFEAGLGEGMVVVLYGFVVLFLSVEGVAEVVLGAIGCAVLVECTAVVDFGTIVVLRLVLAVASAGLFAHGAALSRKE